MFEFTPVIFFISDNGLNHNYQSLAAWALYPSYESFTTFARSSGEWIVFTWRENSVSYYGNLRYGMNNKSTTYLWLALS